MSDLYLFERGSAKWCYNDGLDTISFDGNSYTPEIISTDKINITGDIFKASVKLSIPLSNALVVTIMTNYSPNITTLKIYRDLELFWAGRVVGAGIQKANAILQCESIYSSIKRVGVKSTFERICRYAVYSESCGVDKEDYHEHGIVTVIDGSEITITGVALNDAMYRMGILFSGTEYVTIKTKVGDVFSLMKSVSLTLGQQVKLYAGCEHNMADCHLKFDNLINFGGFPWIPSSNIYEVGII
jgi:uncharacterized phage protein (TIGR02218 family)